MSEDDKAPKKAARKRVVKKGVRGTRAPRKKSIAKEEGSIEGSEAATEEFSSEEVEVTYSLGTDEATESEKSIEVVEESPQPAEEGDSPKAKKKSKSKKKGEEKASAENPSDEEASGGDEKGEGRNRRGRNRRGGNRDREDSGPKRAPIDKDEAAVKAWEIYQGELEEEGVSLVDPRRARDVARRCLELATIFCEERDRYLER